VHGVKDKLYLTEMYRFKVMFKKITVCWDMTEEKPTPCIFRAAHKIYDIVPYFEELTK
jgi:hypothetical protein